MARLDGRPIGCGGLKRLDGGVGEIKRVWTAREARRLGVARRIMATLESEAKRVGLRLVRLGTNRALHEAQALYPQLGYRQIEAGYDDVYSHFWFEKNL